jgi:Xaa-Pro aminopeptidase
MPEPDTIIFPKAGDPVSLVPMSTFLSDHLESSRRGDIIWIEAQNMRMNITSTSIANTLKDLDLVNDNTIGVIGLGPYLPWHLHGIVPFPLWNNILTEFPNVKFKPVAAAFGRVMMPLIQEEIAIVHHSVSIGNAMVRAMAETAAVGVSKAAVYAAAMSKGYSSRTIPAAIHFYSGPDPVAAGWPQWGYRPQAPRILQEGDVISAEMFCNFGAKHTQHQVLIAIGDVHEDYNMSVRRRLLVPSTMRD